MKIQAILFLLLVATANPSGWAAAQEERAYLVRETTGTVETRGWEESLVRANPNLAHWDWEPIKNNVQAVHAINPSGYVTITGTAHPPTRNPYRTDIATPSPPGNREPARPYITLYKQQGPKKDYINLPARNPNQNVPYINLPPRPKPKEDYIRLEPQLLQKRPYIELSDKQTQAQLVSKQPYITLYKPKPQAPYIDVPELNGTLSHEKLAGKLLNKQVAGNLINKNVSGVLASRDLQGTLVNQNPQGRLLDRKQLAPSQPIAMAARPAPPAAPIADSYDEDFMYASSAVGGGAQSHAHVRGKLLVARVAPPAHTSRKRQPKVVQSAPQYISEFDR